MKRLFAILICAALLMGLCACGGGDTRIQDFETEVEKPVVVTPEPVAEPTEQAEPMDWAGAFAKHEPDEVVFTVNGSPVTWQEFFYELAGCTTSLQISANALVTNWNAQLQSSDGSTISVGTYILQNVLSILYQYHAVTDALTKEGVTLSAAGKQAVQDAKQAVIDENFDGDAEQFSLYLQSLFCTEELFDWFNEADQLYYEGFDALYGVNGEKISDAETLDYGVNFNYVQLKQLYCAAPAEEAAEETDAASDEASAEPSAEPVDPKLLTTALASTAKDEDKSALFDELYAKYNQNPALDAYGPERAVYAGDLDSAIYDTALTLSEYGYAVVDVDGVSVCILRTPLRADTPVYLDPVDGTLRDLRYCAAWQAYTDRITGEGGWIESAQIEFSENFQNFNLNELFGLE